MPSFDSFCDSNSTICDQNLFLSKPMFNRLGRGPVIRRFVISSTVEKCFQDLCRLTVERAIVSQIYVHAMFPNGEADMSRDEVLTSHIRRLAEEITPVHRDLRIPRYVKEFMINHDHD